jgi:hypothetical protein
MSGLITMAVIVAVLVALLEVTHRRNRDGLPMAGLGTTDRDTMRTRDELRARWYHSMAPLG